MAAKATIVSGIDPRLASTLGWRERPAPEAISTGSREVDSLITGFPKGHITEIHGLPSSGKTALVLSALAEVTSQQQVCALIDASDAFDPVSATAAGVILSRLLWVRCENKLDRVLRAADLVVEGGGFGLVVLDFGDVPPQIARRIPLASWYRFRRAVEGTSTVLLVISQVPCLHSCASLSLEIKREGVSWSGPVVGRPQLLQGARFGVIPRKPVSSATVCVEARVAG